MRVKIWRDRVRGERKILIKRKGGGQGETGEVARCLLLVYSCETSADREGGSQKGLSLPSFKPECAQIVGYKSTLSANKCWSKSVYEEYLLGYALKLTRHKNHVMNSQPVQAEVTEKR